MDKEINYLCHNSGRKESYESFNINNSKIEDKIESKKLPTNTKSRLKMVDSMTSVDSLFEYSYNTSTYNSSSATPISSSYCDLNKNLNLVYKKLTKICVILVGLPASGKSTMAHKVCQYLNGIDLKSHIYNAGDIRRIVKDSFNDSNYFSPDNLEAKEEREKFALMAIENLIEDLKNDVINVGFLDATNTTIKRREFMINYLKQNGINVVIMNVECNNEKLLNYNINSKANNADYKGRDYESAISDFRERTKHYYKIYEPISEQELKNYHDSVILYIKILNCGETFQFMDDFSSSKNSNVNIVNYFKSFATNYLNEDNGKYFEAVKSFYSENDIPLCV